MELELISRESIKPSTPTPPHNRIHPLSYIDYIVGRNYVPVIYLYPNKASKNDDNQESKISLLKKSLSHVLSIYYPFAGRIRDQFSIDCNDQGVSFLVTRIKSNLSSILNNPNEALLSPLFPDELQWKDMGLSASIVAIQLNLFACGGIAISVCMSHKVGDASTLFNFVNDWATLTTQNNSGEAELPLLPVLDAGSSVFPKGSLPELPEFGFVKQDTVCRRLVFEGSKIESLKSMVSSHKVENPSRVEVVIALIYKSAVSALGLSNTPPMRVAANLRRRIDPPLHDKSIGNWVWSFPVSVDKGDAELHELVAKTREGLSEFCEEKVKNFGDLAFLTEFLKGTLPKRTETTSNASLVPSNKVRPMATLFFFGSWCRLPTYEVDFGWGKPIWVTSIGSPVRNSILLMDTKDGNGIEALVSMEEQNLAIFERDLELLQYASLDPSIK